MDNFATIEDVTKLWRAMTPAEAARAADLIPVVCDSLRAEAQRLGKNLDMMLEESSCLPAVAKSVTVDIVARTLMTSTEQEPMTQYSEAAGGYSASGTFLVPGGGLFIKKSELSRLGLRRQRYGVMNFYGDA